VLETILSKIDLIWVMIGFLIAKGKFRILSALFALCCFLMVRLQTELMVEVGYDYGILNWIDMPILYRAMIVYGVFIGLFFTLVATSKERNAYIFMAAGITLFTIAFCISAAVMVL